MAIVGTIAAGTESKWGFSEEPTFGTVVATSGTYEQIEGPIPSVDYGVTRINQARNDGGRMRKDTSVFHSQSGGIRQINFSDLLVRRVDLGSLLYAVCQNCAEDAVASQFNKVYTMTSTTTQPDFSASAGYFASVGIYDTIASYMRQFPSCILSTLTLSADLTGDGLLRASGTWLSGFTAITTANFSGTWAYNAQNYLDFHAPTVKQIGGADIVLFGFSMTINNGAVRVGGSTLGVAETYALPEYDINGTITVKYDTAVQGLIADSLAGTGRKIQITIGTAATLGHFDISLAECFFDDITKDYGDPRGQALSIPFKATWSTGATMAIFTTCDGTDQDW